jgi:hypothetical protein
MRSRDGAKMDRRDVLRVLSAGAGAVTTAAGVLTTPARADSETDDEKRKARYKETDHVRAYYRVNRYPS